MSSSLDQVSLDRRPTLHDDLNWFFFNNENVSESAVICEGEIYTETSGDTVGASSGVEATRKRERERIEKRNRAPDKEPSCAACRPLQSSQSTDFEHWFEFLHAHGIRSLGDFKTKTCQCHRQKKAFR